MTVLEVIVAVICVICFIAFVVENYDDFSGYTLPSNDDETYTYNDCEHEKKHN